jgi:hypothetical protein
MFQNELPEPAPAVETMLAIDDYNRDKTLPTHAIDRGLADEMLPRLLFPQMVSRWGDFIQSPRELSQD